MKRWEYKVVTAIAMLPSQLNELGAEGWELVAVVKYHCVPVQYRHFFKRRREE